MQSNSSASGGLIYFQYLLQLWQYFQHLCNYSVYKIVKLRGQFSLVKNIYLHNRLCISYVYK